MKPTVPGDNTHAPELISEHGKGQVQVHLTKPVPPIHHQGPAHPVAQKTTPTVRERMAQLMDATVANEPNWHYHAIRPLSYPTLVQAEHGAVSADCSFGCSILAKLAGAGDPLGQHFTGWGNSSSMFAHCQRITRQDLQIGDFAVFGPGGDEHAVCIRKPGADPVCWSHGQEKGPMFVPLSAEKRAHPGAPVTFLRLPTTT